MSIKLITGDCRDVLRSLEAESVQCVITSPPYYGLRDYGSEPLVWGGDPECAHGWGQPLKTAFANKTGAANFEGKTWNLGLNAAAHDRPREAGSFCPCGAWLGSLGLEPTPDLFVEHLVEVFREVRRVLAPTGCAWINLGDSYSGSGNGSNDYRANGSSLSKNDQKYQGQKPGAQPLPAKNLFMMPARVAMALQADGWYLRSQVPWLKRNSMPESTKDRPSNSVEYVFLLSKQSRYFWDADSIRVAAAQSTLRIHSSESVERRAGDWKSNHVGNGHSGLGNGVEHPGLTSGRNRRNSDWFFESWQGLLLDKQDAPLALVVNPQPFKGSHFATFPPKLVEPMVKASTSERGQCPECGAPWVRVVEKGKSDYARITEEQGTTWQDMADVAESQGTNLKAGQRSVGGTRKANGTVPSLHAVPSVLTGWRPSCAHDAEPIPQTVLDPFSGAGTVALVSDRLGRNAIGIDLSDKYVPMAAARVTGEAPMFTELERA